MRPGTSRSPRPPVPRRGRQSRSPAYADSVRRPSEGLVLRTPAALGLLVGLLADAVDERRRLDAAARVPDIEGLVVEAAPELAADRQLAQRREALADAGAAEGEPQVTGAGGLHEALLQR